ncbi:MAG: glutathione peroxidase [Rhodospirillaceae bacterium]|nr:glutathione peroxidase [Rhodospirillaceae bacterium]
MTAVDSIPVAKLDGSPSSLGEWAGKVRLVVNVASKCGLTPQYEGLEKLYTDYKDKGLTVMGFPANNFGAQEPGSNAEIATFCSTHYGVSFPMFAKISVKGEDQHPLYKALIAAQPKAAAKDNSFKERLAGYGIKPDNDTDVLWNFEKFLVGRDGKVIGRFAPDTAADDTLLKDAIEKAL